MKNTLMLFALIALTGLLTGCNPNRVTFKPALISVDPGKDWKRMEVPGAVSPVCSPRLLGKAGMINAVLLEDITDIKKAADHLQRTFSSTSKALPDTFKQEEFTTTDGKPGVHLSYSGKSKDSATPDLRSHSFITRNRRGQCVSVSYITSPDVESAAVIEAISKSLRVE